MLHWGSILTFERYPILRQDTRALLLAAIVQYNLSIYFITKREDPKADNLFLHIHFMVLF